MKPSLKTLIFGFLAGVLAVIVFHQGMVFLLVLTKQSLNPAWNLSLRDGPIPIPVLVNQMFWGGLWGIVFALLGHRIALANVALRGLVFGLIGPNLLGNGFLVPLFRGSGQFFWTWAPSRFVLGALIAGSFGIGVALFWNFLKKR